MSSFSLFIGENIFAKDIIAFIKRINSIPLHQLIGLELSYKQTKSFANKAHSNSLMLTNLFIKQTEFKYFTKLD